jgi:hypothetical protein
MNNTSSNGIPVEYSVNFSAQHDPSSFATLTENLWRINKVGSVDGWVGGQTGEIEKLTALINEFAGVNNPYQWDIVGRKEGTVYNELIWSTDREFIKMDINHGKATEKEAGLNIRYIGTDLERFETLRKMYYENTYEKVESGTIYMLLSTASGYEFQSLPALVNNPLERGNYTPQVMEAYDRAMGDILKRNPAGRIAIFDGPPGSGKTFLIKAMVSELDTEKAVFVFVGSNLLASLSGPEFVPAMIRFASQNEDKALVLIVEDADECIAPRDGYNMSSVSAVLNFGDGLLGSLLDIRLVMTTNAKRTEMDPAILRPGRLSSLIKVDKLPTEQANTVYERLTTKKGEYDVPKTIAEIYSDALGNGWVPPEVPQKHAIGFQHSLVNGNSPVLAKKDY